MNIIEDEVIPRPEESRITEAERNKTINKQLEVDSPIEDTQMKLSVFFMADRVDALSTILCCSVLQST